MNLRVRKVTGASAMMTAQLEYESCECQMEGSLRASWVEMSSLQINVQDEHLMDGGEGFDFWLWVTLNQNWICTPRNYFSHTIDPRWPVALGTVGSSKTRLQGSNVSL